MTAKPTARREVGDKASYTGSHSVIRSKQPEVSTTSQDMLYFYLCSQSLLLQISNILVLFCCMAS